MYSYWCNFNFYKNGNLYIFSGNDLIGLFQDFFAISFPGITPWRYSIINIISWFSEKYIFSFFFSIKKVILNKNAIQYQNWIWQRIFLYRKRSINVSINLCDLIRYSIISIDKRIYWFSSVDNGGQSRRNLLFCAFLRLWSKLSAWLNR